MTTTEYQTFRAALTEQQLAAGIAAEGKRLADERDAARRALRLERADHADTKTELHRAGVENRRLARRVAELEQQLDQAQQDTVPAPVTPPPRFGRQL